jgi:hypothetical protein
MSIRYRSIIVAVLTAASLALAAPLPQVTFHRDVEAILQKRCQTCHRAGEIGPMPLITYHDVRPWAKAIRTAVISRTMPPWDAEPHFGSFSNDRSLRADEIQTITKWVDSGSSEGDPSEAPPAAKFPTGWRIGEPDLVFEMPKEFSVPASGVVDYQWIKMPTGFTEDKWVEAIEIRPGNRSVVHHAVVYAREPEVEYGKKEPYGEFFTLTVDDLRSLRKNAKKSPYSRTMFSTDIEPEHLEVYAPGCDPIQLGPGRARLIKAGADIIFEMHYTPNGKPATDRTRVGIRFAQRPPAERVRSVRMNNGTPLRIPPGEPNYGLESRIETLEPMRIIAFQPHMHLRGKSMEFRATYPTGETETLLSVPRYKFQWQMSYYLQQPKILPVGTIVTCVAVYDNSANNPNNPDPKAWVPGGRQSWDEMMAGFVDFAIAPDASLDMFRDARLPDSTAVTSDPPVAGKARSVKVTLSKDVAPILQNK